jgi:putative ABC transport system permease protein
VSGISGPPADWKGWVIAGVIGDIHTTLRNAPEFYIYSPEGWAPFNFNTFVVRLSRDYDEAFAGLIRRKLYTFNPRIVVSQILPLNGVRDNQLWAERMANSVLKVLAGIALLLTVVGIFSVLAYTVDRRMGEFGVRMAMGATRRDLIQLVMRRGLLLTLAGIVFGLAGSMALTRYLQSLLFETSAQDPWVLAAVGGILLGTSVLACVLPAQRAAKVDISRLLRSE